MAEAHKLDVERRACRACGTVLDSDEIPSGVCAQCERDDRDDSDTEPEDEEGEE